MQARGATIPNRPRVTPGIQPALGIGHKEFLDEARPALVLKTRLLPKGINVFLMPSAELAFTEPAMGAAQKAWLL